MFISSRPRVSVDTAATSIHLSARVPLLSVPHRVLLLCQSSRASPWTIIIDNSFVCVEYKFVDILFESRIGL